MPFNAEVLKSLRLVNYKGFEDCRIPLKGDSVLVGANNAGKSTVIGALRLIAALIPGAQRAEPRVVGDVDDEVLRGWPVTQAAVDAAAFNGENARNDLSNGQVRIEAEFSNGARAIVAWPEREDTDENPPPTFHLVPPVGFKSLRAAARELLPAIGVVPTLAPLDDREQMFTDDALRRNITGRRTSRYFRNALLRVEQDFGGDWEQLTTYLLDNTQEVAGLHVRRRVSPKVDELDLFYEEPGRRHQRELTWAGDGIQIWLQALFHIWRSRESSIVVLDEPDVYLHPDLQRRLARLVFDGPQQIVMATHSVEVLAEAPPGSAVWVDRSRRRAERPKESGALAAVGRRLGSGLELNVARALRSQVVLFVEGDDLALLSVIAGRVGADRVARRRGFATIPLGGFSRREVAAAFAEVVGALGGGIHCHVLLDRDLRHQVALDRLVAEIDGPGVTVTVWSRREIENCVLGVPALARATGLETNDARNLLSDAIAELKDDAHLALTSRRLEEREQGVFGTPRPSVKTVLQDAETEFAHTWSTLEGQVTVTDGKKTISALNRILQSRHLSAVSAMKLAHHLEPEDVPADLRGVLLDIEAQLLRAEPPGSKR